MDTTETVKHVIQPVEQRQLGAKAGRGRGGGRNVGGRGRGTGKEANESKLQLEPLKTRSTTLTTNQEKPKATGDRNAFMEEDEEFDVSISDIFEDKKKKKNPKRKLNSTFLDESEF